MQNMMPDEPVIDYSSIGLRLKQFRKKRGITQEDIAKQLGVTVAYISNVENSKVKLNLRVLSFYADLLGVSIDYLLHTEPSNGNPLDAEILKLLSGFTNAEKEKVIKILHVIKE